MAQPDQVLGDCQLFAEIGTVRIYAGSFTRFMQHIQLACVFASYVYILYIRGVRTMKKNRTMV